MESKFDRDSVGATKELLRRDVLPAGLLYRARRAKFNRKHLTKFKQHLDMLVPNR